jgi:hypothetical protein
MLGYRTFHCSACKRLFNERTGTAFNFLEYPIDVVLLVVLWRLRYKLSLRDLTEMFLERGREFSYETVREWKRRFAPLIAEQSDAERLCCKKSTDLLEWGEKSTRGRIMLEQHPFTWRHFQVEIIRMSCRLVLALCALLPRSRRDDPRTRVAGRSYDDLPLGAAVRARTGEALSTPSQRQQ